MPAPRASAVVVLVLVAGLLAVHAWLLHDVAPAAAGLLSVVDLLVLARAVALVRGSHRHARHRDTRPAPRHDGAVSVVVPVCNEARGIERCVRSLLDTDHGGRVEVIVVDDGSTDDTPVIVWMMQQPGVRLRLLRRPHGGRVPALDAGVAIARHDIVICVDGHTVFERDTIRWLVHRFADPAVGAVTGRTKVAERHGFVGLLHHAEHAGANVERLVYGPGDGRPTVPAAFGAFRRDAWVAAGEGTDRAAAVRRAGWKVVDEDRAVAWTAAPATARAVWRRRCRRWHATVQAVREHRRAPRAGRGLVLFGVVLPLAAPLVDLFTLYGLVSSDRHAVAGAWLAFAGAGLVLGAFALHLDGERPTALGILPLQQLVHRLLVYPVALRSVMAAVAGGRRTRPARDRAVPRVAWRVARPARRRISNRDAPAC